ncbi:MAG TPA: patatin-like phospholipase family protein [Bryobacteraceae bacterium]|jgi:hypothetical protein
MPDHIKDKIKSAIAAEMQGIAAQVGRDGSAPHLTTAEMSEQLDGLKLFGLAFSGGGIRSATFCLGVMEGLHQLGLLKFVDYLSTVSGGGYIGSWYVSCLRQGLDPTEDKAANQHIRKFSRYLAPEAGFFSADTWTIAMSWLRNTILLQTMLVSLFAVLLLLPRFFEWAFLEADPDWTEWIALGLFLLAAVQIVYRLSRMNRMDAQHAGSDVGTRLKRALHIDNQHADKQGPLQVTILLPMLAGGAFFSSTLWKQTTEPWPLIAGAAATVALASWVTAEFSLLEEQRRKWCWFFGAGAIGVLCGALFGSLVYATNLVYLKWSDPLLYPKGIWIAGLVGAPAILGGLALTVVVQIGLLGRAIDDSRREWWSRLGAFLAIYSLAALGLGAMTVFGPLVWSKVGTVWTWVRGTITVGGAITTLTGLFAAKSPKTGCEGESSAKEWLAAVAPLVFIALVMLGVSEGLHAALANYEMCDGSVWDSLNCTIQDEPLIATTGALGICAAVLALLAWRLDINEASMNPFYRNRLVRCYLGAARAASGLRHPNLFTGFDFGDDYALSDLRAGKHYRGPVPILNTTLNLTGQDNAAMQERRGTSFFFTPYQSGSDLTEFIDTAKTGKMHGGVRLGTCVSASGAAASPNMGYHTSAPVAFLLTFFNVRLGWWIATPHSGKSQQSPRWGLWYLLKELFGTADYFDKYLYLSDGGHFENLGVYELVRRRCRYIIAADAEADHALTLESLGGLVRKCRIDFDVEIEIDTSQIRQQDENGLSRAHCAVGRIHYKNPDQVGYLIYLKSSLTGDEDSDVLQYKAKNFMFPHESTGDQFFSESQFESYRGLGMHIAQEAFRPAAAIERREGLEAVMSAANDAWAPPSPFTEEHFSHHAEQLTRLWDRIRREGFEGLDQQFYPGWSADVDGPGYKNLRQSLYVCQSILQLMENVYLNLHLDTEWGHPDNQGWRKLFEIWAKSSALQDVFQRSGETYGKRFREFCRQQLGLREKQEK